MSKIIDFANLAGPIYTGRPKGELARQHFRLDELDAQLDAVIVKIPESTYSITNSFFLGMFGPSINRFGTREGFLNHYQFDTSPMLQKRLDSHIERGLQPRGVLDVR